MNLGLQILLDAVRTVVAAIWRKRVFALVAFLANWACQQLSPTGWAGVVLNDAFHLVEHEASRLGWSLLAALALLAVLLIAEVAAERRSGGFHRGWVVDAARWAVTWHLIPSMATVCASVFGVCAAFGLDGALFGGAFLSIRPRCIAIRHGATARNRGQPTDSPRRSAIPLETAMDRMPQIRCHAMTSSRKS